MTEEEKELEQKLKQYEYEKKEIDKRIEQLYKDAHTKKKSKIKKVNKTFEKILYIYMAIVVMGTIYAFIFAVKGYISTLNEAFNYIDVVEEKYDIHVQQLSRYAENKVITYKVKPTKWKYRKISFLIVRLGETKKILDDFDDRTLKYIIDKIEDKSIISGFEISEKYDENNLLDYSLVYKLSEGESNESAMQKVQALKNYILSYDKNVTKIVKFYKITVE